MNTSGSGRAARAVATALGLVVAAVVLPASAADVRTVEITATEFEFQPSKIQVEQGETIRLQLVNQGRLSHNLHLRGIDEHTKTIQSGATDTIEFTARESGTVEFFCNVPGHEQAGMTGSIVVE